MSRREGLARLMGRFGASSAILRVRERLSAPVLTVLTYHSVGEVDASYPYDPEVVDASPAQFERQLRILRECCNVISLDDLLAALADRTRLPPNATLITFDDGYRSNFDTAVPILKTFGCSAVFFAATDFVNHRRAYWWDRTHYIQRAARNLRFRIDYPNEMSFDLSSPSRRDQEILRALNLIKHTFDLDVERFLAQLASGASVTWSEEVSARIADELIMTWDDLRALRDAGMYVQSHTRGHRVLGTLGLAALVDELDGSRRDIEAELSVSVDTIAYPVGNSVASNEQIRRGLIDAGYRVGFSNKSGANYNWKKMDPLDVHRFAMDRNLSDEMFLAQLAVPRLRYR